MTDMDEIAYVDSLDDEALFEWEDEASAWDDESVDDEAFFRPRQPARPAQRRRPRTRLALPSRLQPGRAGRPPHGRELVSNDRRLAQNDQRLAQNDRRLAQGQERLASRVEQLDKGQGVQLGKLAKFEKTINERLKAMESSSQLAMILPLIARSDPQLASFTDAETNRVVNVKAGSTTFAEGDGFDPILLLAMTQMTGTQGQGLGGANSGANAQNGLFSSPLGLILMLKLLDK